MGHFAQREFVEEAEIPSMFRFPNTKKLKISCVVTECEGNCETRSCDTDSSASSLLERTTASTESEDYQKVWTIVNLEETVEPLPMVSESVDDEEIVRQVMRDVETPPPNLIVQKTRDKVYHSDCISESDFKLLYYLCIFLASECESRIFHRPISIFPVCSIVGFTMNIVMAIMLKRRSAKKPKRCSVPVEQLQIPKTTVVQPDFWIIENAKGTLDIATRRQTTVVSDVPEHEYFEESHDSLSSYASVRNEIVN